MFKPMQWAIEHTQTARPKLLFTEKMWSKEKVQAK